MLFKQLLRFVVSWAVVLSVALVQPTCALAASEWQTTPEGTVYIDNNGNRAKGLKYINDHLYFFDDNGYCADELGIDVSEFNHDINWSEAANSGISFAVIRIGGRGWGSGNIYNDSYALPNLREASAQNLKIGVYFYSTAVNPEEAVAEAEYVADMLSGIKLDMPVFFDTEWSGDYPDGRADELSPNLQSKLADAFCSRIEMHGYQAGTYSNLNYYYYSINYSVVESYDVWMASYTENYSDPEFKYRWDIWQFTDSEKLSGIDGTVDFNAIFYR